MDEIVAPCPLCHHELSSRLDGVWNWRGIDYRLLRCDVCGSGRSEPIPTDGVLRALYAHDFDYQWYRDHLRAKLRDAAMRLDEYAPFLGQRVLDYGGGLGYLSQQARKRGLESITYDPYGTTHQGAPCEDSWDSVVASHVLEHSNDPESTVMHMKRFLNPGGRLILAVPNFAARGYRELGMDWVWAQPPVIHIFHFTEHGLGVLLTRCGFSDIQVSYSDRWDANGEADIHRVEHFRNLSRSWSRARHGSFVGAGIKRHLLALWTSRARFAALKHATAQKVENRPDLAELQIIATVC